MKLALFAAPFSAKKRRNLLQLIFSRPLALFGAFLPSIALCEQAPFKTIAPGETIGRPEDWNWATALAPARDGSVWIGTNAGGLARLDKNGRWETYTKANTNGGLLDDHVGALRLATDGSLWVGNRSGVTQRSKDGHWKSYPSPDHRLTLGIGALELDAKMARF